MRASLGVLGYAMGLLPGLSLGSAALNLVAPGYAPPARTLAAGDSSGHAQIIDAVQKRYHAKVVRVTETTVNGRPALQLRLLSEQRVWSVVVDATSGQVLSGG